MPPKIRLLSCAACLSLSLAQAQSPTPAPSPLPPGATLSPQPQHSAYDAVLANAKPSASPLVTGKRALAAKNFLTAKNVFATEAKLHPGNLEAQLGLGDAELGLHEYEPAELQYRRVVAAQPETWQAHKNLVIVEAALGRWEEFDRERALLRLARQREAPGISARESDVIDGFTLHNQRWIVREYFEPAGRSLTRYNFEHFSPTGKAEEYISLESEEAAKAVTPGGAVAIGNEPPPTPAASHYALNWYTGKSHGTIATYGQQEPTYKQVRTDVMRWLRR
jgi:tetratricopeptide (TPR) repeat protein